MTVYIMLKTISDTFLNIPSYTYRMCQQCHVSSMPTKKNAEKVLVLYCAVMICKVD